MRSFNASDKIGICMHTVMAAYGNKVSMPDVVHPDPLFSDWPDPDLTEEL